MGVHLTPPHPFVGRSRVNYTSFGTGALERKDLILLLFLLLPRTEREWDNSLIIKRVLFEVFDCFLPLFYIAFYQLNVVALRRELVGLFWGKERVVHLCVALGCLPAVASDLIKTIPISIVVLTCALLCLILPCLVCVSTQTLLA